MSYVLFRGMDFDRTESLSSRALLWAFLVLGILVRAWPLLVQDGFRVGTEFYDDGVYFSASALLARGNWLYRDFVFVHPPGLPLALLSVSWMPPDVGYLASRWLFVALGALNLSLVGLGVKRWLGAWPAVVAVATYALLPDVIVYERAPFLEPLINSCGLAALFLAGGSSKRWHSVAMGILLGLACSVKLTAITWALPIAWLSFRRGGCRAVVETFLSAFLIGLLIWLPFVWKAPIQMWEQIVAFHLWRPPDGLSGAWARWVDILYRGWALYLLAIVSLFFQKRSLQTDFRLRDLKISFGLIAGAQLLLMLTARTYWHEYLAAFGPVQCVLMAWITASFLSQSRRAWHAWGLALLLGATFVRVSWVRKLTFQGTDSVLETVKHLHANMRNDESAWAMEPLPLLAAGRLPEGQPLIVDSYGELLLSAKTAGVQSASLQETLGSAAPQQRLLEKMKGCDWLVWGKRGDFQSTETTRTLLSTDWEPTWGRTGVDYFTVWRQRKSAK